MPHALIIEGDKRSADSLAEIVGCQGFSAAVAREPKQARSALDERSPDVVLLDADLPDGSGMELLKELGKGSRFEVILITTDAKVDTAVAALRNGAADYLTKPVDAQRLKSVLAGIAKSCELREEIEALRGDLRSLGRLGPLLGISEAMQGVYDLISKVAPTDFTAFLIGESGTGKEIAAQAIHKLSRRRQKPFLPLNCGAVSPNLIESELFGHERGSFTGATRTHKGYFERAAGGTLFLDEITEMPVELQVKLLRVLESSTILRIGGIEPIEIDVRVIAATNRVPEEAVEEGKLRKDLLYRLKVFPVHMPPLRERGRDIELLAAHFLEEINRQHGASKKLSEDALAAMRAYPWPGNVRELKNAIQRAFLLTDSVISRDSLPGEITSSGSASIPELRRPAPVNELGDAPAFSIRVGISLAEAERRIILATVDHLDGDKKAAARELGISIRTLYNRLKKYGKN